MIELTDEMAIDEREELTFPEPKPGAERSLIAPGLVIRGTVEGGGALTVGGEIIGECRVRRFEVAEGGHVDGRIIADTFESAGSVDGSVLCNSVKLKAEATSTADLVYGDLEVAEGAKVEGVLRSLR